MIRARALLGCVFKFLSAATGVERGAAIAGGKVIGGKSWIFGALGFVVRRGEAGDECAGTIGCDLVIVVARKVNDQ